MFNRFVRMHVVRPRDPESERGFTLIELLVVVIIIGILAAIAIPIYLGVNNNAKDSAVRSDLASVKNALAGYIQQNKSFPTIDTSTLKPYGYAGTSVNYSVSPATAPAYKGSVPADNATTFCIWATSPTGNKFSVSDGTGVITGACP